MELTFFTWVLRESIDVNQVNDTNTFQGLKPLSFIEWELFIGAERSYSRDLVVCHGFVK